MKLIFIMGPSGAGKTTLTNFLVKNGQCSLARHTTTREKRIDDIPGFYRYLTVDEFKNLKDENKFLISSFDNIRGYGVLKDDVVGNNVLINASYKDIDQIIELKSEVIVIALTFKNLEKGILKRINVDERKHSANDINYRIESAISDHQKYFKKIKEHANLIIYTDEVGIEEMCKKALDEVRSSKLHENMSSTRRIS